MPPLAVAAVGAAVGIGGAVLSANAQKKAASQAAGAQKDASAANIKLAEQTYAQNAQRLDPYSANGMTAGNAIMSILGFPGAPAGTMADGVQHLPTPVGQEPVAPEFGGGLFHGGAIRDHIIQKIQNGETVDPQALQQFGLTDYASKYQAWKTGGMTAAQPITSGNAMAAFDVFRNSSDYNWRFNQGEKAVQQGMGALGAFDSGATRKAEIEYGQHFASGELGTWMDRLAQQQGIGLGAASALAGVSQNMAGSVMNANNASAAASGNAALIRGAANQNMYGQIAGALGGLASSFIKPPGG